MIPYSQDPNNFPPSTLLAPPRIIHLCGELCLFDITIINYIVSKFYSTGTVEYADLFNDLPTDISNTLTEIYDTDYVTKEPLSVLLKILKDEYLQHLKIKEIAEEAYETNDKEKKLELAKKIMEDLKKKDSLKRKDLKK